MRRLIASWFGTGLLLGKLRGSDMGSGTVAAAVTFALGWALTPWGWVAQLAAAIVVTGLSVWTAQPFAHGGVDPGSAPGVAPSKEGDPGWVVVDEAAGTLIAMIGLGLPAAIAGWFVFRAADIFKDRFPGVAAAERLAGGVGITTDDAVAGCYGLAAGWMLQALIG